MAAAGTLAPGSNIEAKPAKEAGTSVEALSAPKDFNRRQIDTGREAADAIKAGCKRLAGILSDGLLWGMGASINGAKAGYSGVVEGARAAHKFFEDKVEAVKTQGTLFVANLSKKSFDKGIRSVEKEVESAGLEPDRANALILELGNRVGVIRDFIGRQLSEGGKLSPTNQLRAWKFATKNLDLITSAMKAEVGIEKQIKTLEDSRTNKVSMAINEIVKADGLSEKGKGAVKATLMSELEQLSKKGFDEVRAKGEYAHGSRGERLAVEKIVASKLNETLGLTDDLIELAKAEETQERIRAKFEKRKAA